MADTQDQTVQNPPALEIPKEIRAFLENLLDSAGITSVEPEMREQMIEELYVRLDKYIIAKVTENMPDEKLDEFAKLFENKADMSQIQEYLLKNLPNAQEVFAQAFVEFENIYLEGVAQAQPIEEEQQIAEQPQEKTAEQIAIDTAIKQ